MVLQLEQVSALNDMNTVGLNNVRLAVRAGEIYGIAGVSGNGQRELAEVICRTAAVDGRKNIFTDRTLPIKTERNDRSRYQLCAGGSSGYGAGAKSGFCQ